MFREMCVGNQFHADADKDTVAIPVSKFPKLEDAMCKIW